MKEVSDFLGRFDLLPGTILEYGSYQGKMLDYLIKKYPTHEVIGIDINNINDHPNIIEIDIKEFDNICHLSLAINDLIDFNRDLESKLAGRTHALKNLINGGLYIEGSSTPVRRIDGLELVQSSKYISFFVKNS
jgi:hypothetical protein